MRGAIRGAAALAALALASGCMSMRTPMTDFATDYNRVIADSRNEMILLNILRAQHREPVYFSSVSQIEGALSVGAEASSELGLGYDGDPATEDVSVAPSLAVSAASEPTFTVVPLNTAEFVRGVLTPIRPETIRLLLSQGWRDYLLAPLLIERLTCPAARGAQPIEIENDPRNYSGGPSLQDFADIRIRRQPGEGATYTVEVDDSALAALLVEANASRYEVAQSRRVTRVVGGGEVPRSIVTMERDGGEEIAFGVPASLAVRCGGSAPGETLAEASEEGSGMVAHVRSIEGIIYYLGELIRADRPATLRDPDGDERLLFGVSRGHGPAAVGVGYRGERYYIPLIEDGAAPARDDRSLQVISLINQLLALQTSSDDLNRVSSTVRVR